MSYGERDNEDFLVHYGFVPEANPHDSVELFAGGVREAAIWFLDRTSGGSRRANQEARPATASPTPVEPQFPPARLT